MKLEQESPPNYDSYQELSVTRNGDILSFKIKENLQSRARNFQPKK